MSLLRKILVVLLAALMLVATTGVSIHKHYCMGQLRSVAFHSHASHCCDTEKQPIGEGFDCCEHTSDTYQVDDEQQFQLNKIHLKGKYHLISTYLMVAVQARLLKAGAEDQRQYYNYKPPLIAQDIPVAVQSFLL